jgi:hypothetical protein
LLSSLLLGSVALQRCRWAARFKNFPLLIKNLTTVKKRLLDKCKIAY